MVGASGSSPTTPRRRAPVGARKWRANQETMPGRQRGRFAEPNPEPDLGVDVRSCRLERPDPTAGHGTARQVCSVDNVVEKPDSDEEELFDDGSPIEIGVDGNVDLDDQLAGDLDIGIELEELRDTAPEAEREFDWDHAGLIQPAPDEATDLDDTTGPMEFDPSIGLAAPGEENLDDASLGLEDTDPLVSPALPELVRQDDNEGPLFSDLELDLPDERHIPAAVTPWQQILQESGLFETLYEAQGRVFGGGNELLVVDRERTLRVSCPSALLSLTGHPIDGTTRLFAASKSGEVYSFSPPDYADPVRVAWSAGSEPLATVGAGPQLAGWVDPNGKAELVLLARGGPLVRFDTAAGTFSNWELPLPPRLLPLVADRPLLLGAGTEGLEILELCAGSTDWQRRNLDPRVEQMQRLGPFEFAVRDAVVVFAGARAGVLLSNDRGNTVARVPGCVATSALTIGSYQGAIRIWLALGHEVSNQTDLVCLDPASLTLTRIARFDTAVEDEFSPVRSLLWVAERRSIFAAGEFGVRGFLAPE